VAATYSAVCEGFVVVEVDDVTVDVVEVDDVTVDVVEVDDVTVDVVEVDDVTVDVVDDDVVTVDVVEVDDVTVDVVEGTALNNATTVPGELTVMFVVADEELVKVMFEFVSHPTNS